MLIIKVPCFERESSDDKTPVSIKIYGWSVQIYTRFRAVISHMGGFANKLFKMI